MDLLTRALSPWGESIFTHISWSLFWASLVGGMLFLLAHGGYMLFSRHEKRDPAEVDRMESERKGPAGEDRASLVRRADVPLGDGVLDAGAALHRVSADRRRPLRVGGVALVGGAAPDRLDHLPHLPRDLRAGLLVDLGRAERHPRAQGGDAARDRQGAAAGRSPASIRWATGCITSP